MPFKAPHTTSARFFVPRYPKGGTAIISAAIAAIIGLSACQQQEAKPPAPRPALAYQIKTGAGAETELYAGEIRARVEADHAFRIGGKIVQRMVDAGASVKKGQALARLDPQDTKLASDASASQVAAQKTEVDFADSERKRYQDLFTKGFVSQSALDQKTSIANAAQARLDAARAQAAVSINQAGYSVLVAEMDGLVTQVLAEAGQVVAAGQAVMRIANPREKELAISASESKLADFRKVFAKPDNSNTPPTNLRVALWSQPGKYYNAKIREISGAADPAARTYAVRLSIIKPDDAIQLGMSAYAVFGDANESSTLTVPLSSIYVKGDPKGDMVGVWAIAADGKVSLKPIKVLQYRETTAFIEPVTGAASGSGSGSGSVKAGDLIVAAGVHKLREGEVVKPIIDTQIKGDGKVAYATPARTIGIAADNLKTAEVAVLAQRP